MKTIKRIPTLNVKFVRATAKRGGRGENGGEGVRGGSFQSRDLRYTSPTPLPLRAQSPMKTD